MTNRFQIQLFEDGVEEFGDGAVGGHGAGSSEAGHVCGAGVWDGGLIVVRVALIERES